MMSQKPRKETNRCYWKMGERAKEISCFGFVKAIMSLIISIRIVPNSMEWEWGEPKTISYVGK